MDDALALEALLELSSTLNPKSRLLPGKTFPLLDRATVALALSSVAYCVENKLKRRSQSVSLAKKWCDVRHAGASRTHITWMGTTFNCQATIDSLLGICDILLDEQSIGRNWLCLELPQQQAVCLAISCVASECKRARSPCIRLFNYIVDNKELVVNHSHFLDDIWKLRGLLELSIDRIELLVQNSPQCLERELLEMAADCIRNEGSQINFCGQKEDITSLINLCISSPVIFQVSSSILMQLLVRSGAHQTVVNILINFVQECLLNEKNVVKLFPKKCQVALALLNIPPDLTEHSRYIGYLLDALENLPAATVALLLVLNPEWLPFVADKLGSLLP